jgi:hypothetical protein
MGRGLQNCNYRHHIQYQMRFQKLCNSILITHKSPERAAYISEAVKPLERHQNENDFENEYGKMHKVNRILVFLHASLTTITNSQITLRPLRTLCVLCG